MGLGRIAVAVLLFGAGVYAGISYTGGGAVSGADLSALVAPPNEASAGPFQVVRLEEDRLLVEADEDQVGLRPIRIEAPDGRSETFYLDRDTQNHQKVVVYWESSDLPSGNYTIESGSIKVEGWVAHQSETVYLERPEN